MAREKEDTRKKGGGVSLDDEDAIDVGLFGAGPAVITESLFTEYDYGGTVKGRKPVVWLITFSRGEGKATEKGEQPYGIGNGWSLDRDGQLVGKNGQTGLPKTCNAMVHLVKPLKKALKKAGLDADFLADGDPAALEGMEVEIDRVEQEERDFRNRDREERGGRGRDRDDRDDDRRKEPKTILEIVAVESMGGGKKSSGKKAKSRDEEDEDEAPRGKRGSRDADEDEKPARGKANGKGKDADEEDEADEDPIEEEAIEAMIALVEKGAVDVDDMEGKLKKVLKGNKQIDAIIDLCMTPKFMKLEKGWSYDKKANAIDAAAD